MYKIVHHGKFETFIMIVIVLSSFKLVFDTYTDKLAPDSMLVRLYLALTPSRLWSLPDSI